MVVLIFFMSIASGFSNKNVCLFQCAAAAALLCVVCINYVNVKAASKVQSVLFVSKFIGMTIIFVGGMVRLGQGDKVGLNNLQNAFLAEDLAGLSFTQIGLSFYQGLWAYDGWSNLTYISEEVKNSKRTVPLAIIIAVPLVTVFYILVNVAYFSGKKHSAGIFFIEVCIYLESLTIGVVIMDYLLAKKYIFTAFASHLVL